jgi:hypothetical protein
MKALRTRSDLPKVMSIVSRDSRNVPNQPSRLPAPGGPGTGFAPIHQGVAQIDPHLYGVGKRGKESTPQ